MLLCNEEEKLSQVSVPENMVSNISNDDIDCTNNNFVLHMYLNIFV